jgi:hypothetical protein
MANSRNYGLNMANTRNYGLNMANSTFLSSRYGEFGQIFSTKIPFLGSPSGKNWPQIKPLPERRDDLFKTVGRSFACTSKAATSFQGLKVPCIKM